MEATEHENGNGQNETASGEEKMKSDKKEVPGETYCYISLLKSCCCYDI